MRLGLFFLPNFPEATFIQGGTFIPDSRVPKVRCASIVNSIYCFSLATPIKITFITEHIMLP